MKEESRPLLSDSRFSMPLFGGIFSGMLTGKAAGGQGGGKAYAFHVLIGSHGDAG